jgi:hypothetical protein
MMSLRGLASLSKEDPSQRRPMLYVFAFPNVSDVRASIPITAPVGTVTMDRDVFLSPMVHLFLVSSVITNNVCISWYRNL